MRVVLGIDPGITGAVAFYRPDNGAGFRWTLLEMPLINSPGSEQKELDVIAFRDLLAAHDPDHAFLERATAMPTIMGTRSMGAAGAFRYGGMFFALRAVLACCSIPCTLVMPQQWKKFAGLRGSDKEQSRAKAIELFPDVAGGLSRKKDHARAEAMLLAWYGDSKCL